MTKPFFSSVIIHAILIAIISFVFATKINKNQTIKPQKIISLKHIVLKNPQLKQAPPPQKEPEEKTTKKKQEVKPKKVISKPKPTPQKKYKPKKKKKVHHKKVVKKIKKYHKKTTKKIHKLTKQAVSKEYTQPVQAPRQIYLQLNKNKIYEAIQRAKRYPRIAKKLHIQGTVKVVFTLHPNGEVSDIKTSNAHNILQKSAKKTILEASTEFPKPKNKITISLNIKYKLR